MGLDGVGRMPVVVSSVVIELGVMVVMVRALITVVGHPTVWCGEARLEAGVIIFVFNEFG